MKEGFEIEEKEGGGGATMGGSDDSMPDWERAHAELVRIAEARGRLDIEEGYWLVRALRSGVHRKLGYASFGEYVERLFGYSPRWTSEKLRVAEALEVLPLLSAAVDRGELTWSAARELTRTATPETETEWLGCALGRTAREVEGLVSGHAVGSRPSDAADPLAKRHVLRFEVSALVLATFREATAKLRREADGPLDNDSTLLLMARHVLGGSSDGGGASYQVAVHVCERCRQGSVQAGGQLVAVEPDVVEMASCDAQVFTTDGHTHVGTAESRAKGSIAPSVRRRVHHRDRGGCRVPGCRHSVFVDIHHIQARADGGSNDPENLLTLCAAHHRALHRGELVLEGRASESLVFRHSDGSEYGHRSVSPRAADARAMVFRALCSLGFRQSEARRGLARAVTHVGNDASTEDLLRRALAELTASGRKAA